MHRWSQCYYYIIYIYIYSSLSANLPWLYLNLPLHTHRKTDHVTRSSAPWVVVTSVIHYSFFTFSPQAVCEVILETVFPTSAMFLLADVISHYNTTRLSELRSAKGHLDILCGVLLAGSMAEGLTMQLHWGHPAPDADLMLLFGGMLGVTLPHQVAPAIHHEIECAPSSPETSIVFFLDCITSFLSPNPAQLSAIDGFKTMLSLISIVGISTFLELLPTVEHPLLNEASIKSLAFLSLLKNKSCLEYAPAGCPLAYTRLRGINVDELPHIYAEFFEEEDGHLWLKTRHLNEQIQQCYNIVASYPATPSTTSGPAGQVHSLEK